MSYSPENAKVLFSCSDLGFWEVKNVTGIWVVFARVEKVGSS